MTGVLTPCILEIIYINLKIEITFSVKYNQTISVKLWFIHGHNFIKNSILNFNYNAR